MGALKHRAVQFGIYEVDLDDGEVRKAGVRIKVQQQPFKVLQALLEQPGELVSREQLHDRIWPGASYGDFDQAVNVAVAKLRTALGDSADNPRFIETVPRRGYRFIAPVRAEIHPDRFSSPATANGEALHRSLLSPGAESSWFGKRTTLVLASLLALIAVVGAALLLFGQPRLTTLSIGSRMAKGRSVPLVSVRTGTALFMVRLGTVSLCNFSGRRAKVLSHVLIP